MKEYRKESELYQKKIIGIQKNMREKFNKDNQWFFFDSGEKTAALNWVLWVIWSKETFCLELYNRSELILSENFLWTHKPSFGISYEDQEKIFSERGILNDLINKAKL